MGVTSVHIRVQLFRERLSKKKKHKSARDKTEFKGSMVRGIEVLHVLNEI